MVRVRARHACRGRATSAAILRGFHARRRHLRDSSCPVSPPDRRYLGTERASLHRSKSPCSAPSLSWPCFSPWPAPWPRAPRTPRPAPAPRAQLFRGLQPQRSPPNLCPSRSRPPLTLPSRASRRTRPRRRTRSRRLIRRAARAWCWSRATTARTFARSASSGRTLRRTSWPAAPGSGRASASASGCTSATASTGTSTCPRATRSRPATCRGPRPQDLCDKDGKRLCMETEWELACEGEQMLPYPTGYERDPEGVQLRQGRPGRRAHGQAARSARARGRRRQRA